MRRLPALVAAVTLSLSLHLLSCACFTVPKATLQFLTPTGLRISVPATDPEVSLVAFHVNINAKFVGVDHGQWAEDIRQPQRGHWSYTIWDLRAVPGDTIYYWVYAIKNGVGYQLVDQSYRVTEDDLHVSELLDSAKPMAAEASSRPTAVSSTSPMIDKTSSRPTAASSTSPMIVGASSRPTAAISTSPMIAETSSRPTATSSTSPITAMPSCRDSEASLSFVSQPSGSYIPCTGSDVFFASFHTARDLHNWDHEMYIGGNEPDDEFTVFRRDEEVARITNHHLVIRPALLDHKYYKDFIFNGSLTVDPCTASEPQYCQANGTQTQMLPPILSARLSTRHSFSFRYGTIQIKAKLPKGDWIVPELWLKPVHANDSQSGHIIVAQSRGNSQLTVESDSIASDVLEAGIVFNSARVTFDQKQNTSWADDYHVFKLVWKPNVIELFVDNFEYAKWAPGRARPLLFDTEFYISLGIHVGGLRDFPDRAVSSNRPKPWSNTDPNAKQTFWQAMDNWFPSWNEHSALFVEYVKVTAL